MRSKKFDRRGHPIRQRNKKGAFALARLLNVFSHTRTLYPGGTVCPKVERQNLR
jgi:hypothetical protein